MKDHSKVILSHMLMYGIFTNICPDNHPNAGKISIHGAYGYITKI